MSIHHPSSVIFTRIAKQIQWCCRPQWHGTQSPHRSSWYGWQRRSGKQCPCCLSFGQRISSSASGPARLTWNVRSLIGRDSEEASVLEQKVSLSNPETLCDRSVASVAAVCDGELKLSVSSNVSLLTAWHGCVERQSIAWEVEAEDCAGGPVVVDRDLRDVWGVGRGVLVEPEGRAVGGDRGVLNVATGADGNTAEVDGLLAALAGLSKC